MFDGWIWLVGLAGWLQLLQVCVVVPGAWDWIGWIDGGTVAVSAVCGSSDKVLADSCEYCSYRYDIRK